MKEGFFMDKNMSNLVILNMGSTLDRLGLITEVLPKVELRVPLENWLITFSPALVSDLR